MIADEILAEYLTPNEVRMCKIQELIMGLNEETYKEVKSELPNYLDPQHKELFKPFVQTMFIFVDFHSADIPTMVRLVKSLDPAIPIKDMILKTYYEAPVKKPCRAFFLHELYLNEYVTVDEIITVFKLIRVNHPKSFYDVMLLYMWFAPEVDQYDPELCQTILTHFDEEVLFPDMYVFKNKMDEYKANNWELQRKYAKIGYSQEKIPTIFRNDDVDKLQKLTASFDFDMNQKVMITPFERCSIYLNGPTLIQVAAYMGSIQCFKLLMLNGSDLNALDNTYHNLMFYIVAGGNYEILRIIYQQTLSISGALQVACMYHRQEIIQWILDLQLQQLNEIDYHNRTTLHGCAKGFNIAMLVYCLHNGVSCNIMCEDSQVPLHIACDSGYHMIVDILLRCKDIKVNVPDALGVFFHFIGFHYILQL